MLGVITAIAMFAYQKLQMREEVRGESDLLARMLTQKIVRKEKSRERVVLVSALVVTCFHRNAASSPTRSPDTPNEVDNPDTSRCTNAIPPEQ